MDSDQPDTKFRIVDIVKYDLYVSVNVIMHEKMYTLHATLIELNRHSLEEIIRKQLQVIVKLEEMDFSNYINKEYDVFPLKEKMAYG
jgi:hypothetical protein